MIRTNVYDLLAYDYMIEMHLLKTSSSHHRLLVPSLYPSLFYFNLYSLSIMNAETRM